MGVLRQKCVIMELVIINLDPLQRLNMFKQFMKTPNTPMDFHMMTFLVHLNEFLLLTIP